MWYVIPQFVGFLIFMVAASPRPTARRSTSSRPTPSSSQGYMTEYGGGRFASYYFAEYLNVLVVSRRS